MDVCARLSRVAAMNQQSKSCDTKQNGPIKSQYDDDITENDIQLCSELQSRLEAIQVSPSLLSSSTE